MVTSFVTDLCYRFRRPALPEVVRNRAKSLARGNMVASQKIDRRIVAFFKIRISQTQMLAKGQSAESVNFRTQSSHA